MYFTFQCLRSCCIYHSKHTITPSSSIYGTTMVHSWYIAVISDHLHRPPICSHPSFLLWYQWNEQIPTLLYKLFKEWPSWKKTCSCYPSYIILYSQHSLLVFMVHSIHFCNSVFTLGHIHALSTCYLSSGPKTYVFERVTSTNRPPPTNIICISRIAMSWFYSIMWR